MKMITQAIVPACLLASTLFVFTSCTTVNTVERATPIGTKQVIADKRVITDSTLNKKVSIVGMNEGMTPGGFLQVQIEVLNRKNSMQSFSYRFEWFDMNGMLVDTPTSVWIPRQIEGQETLTITAVAPTTITKDFRVKFMENVRND
ncbi:MAG TPA: YcfL family protein [Candidatus Wunengus sp. YC65]|uniref:YcfL family protein n=1 Tax=Candidatus Wunengus sp. YC65 TaxID=3367701 RepID=UPI0040265BCE